MPKYLLDTNIISEFGRDRPETRVIHFLENQALDTLFVPDIVLAEVRFGISLLGDATRQKHYASVLDNAIRPLFGERVLSAGEETWFLWKRLEHKGRLRRYTFQQPDLMIAALAIEHGLTVVTRDTEPFREAEAPYFNPWLKAS